MSNRFGRKLFLRHIKYLIGVLIIWINYVLSGIGCPSYRILGIRCPACGTTRAITGLLLGNWELYLKLNPFALPLIFSVLLGIRLSLMPNKYKKYGTFVIIVITISNFCWYISTLI